MAINTLKNIILFDPEIRINNSTVATIANSIKIIWGNGESSLIAQSVGNGAVQHVYSENVETKIAKLKFSLASTSENMDLIITLKNNRNTNYIVLNSSTSNKSIVMKNVALTNDPEMSLSNEGQMDLEFVGKIQG